MNADPHIPAGIAEGQLKTPFRHWLQRNEVSIFPTSWLRVVRSMQEGGADGDLLMATKNQPVQLVCPKAFPGQRLIKRTPPIPVSKENAYTMYVHTRTRSGILTALYM